MSVGEWGTPYKTPSTFCGSAVHPPQTIFNHFKLQTMQEMQNIQDYVITSGKKTENGNFSGYTLFGKRIHIFGHQMASANLDVASPEFPFVVVAEEKSYEAQVGADGIKIGKDIVNRLTATAVFANEDKYADAKAYVLGFNDRVERKVARKVKALEVPADPADLT